MKHLFTAIGMAIALALPATTSAQGRHDEKPHAIVKQAGDGEKEARAPATGGRHDEGPTSHGKKKPTAKKKASKSEEAPARE